MQEQLMTVEQFEEIFVPEVAGADEDYSEPTYEEKREEAVMYISKHLKIAFNEILGDFEEHNSIEETDIIAEAREV